MQKKLENKLQTSVLSGIFDLGFQPRSGIPGSVSVWKLYYTSAVKHFIFLLHSVRHGLTNLQPGPAQAHGL